MPEYRQEYVSASADMSPITASAQWSLDFWLANRGGTTESFSVTLMSRVATEIDGSGTVDFPPAVLSGDIAVEPLQAGHFSVSSADVGPTVLDYESAWARILVTSPDLVPTMRLKVTGNPNAQVPDDPVTEYNGPPEFYFGPGDFAVFPAPTIYGGAGPVGPGGGVIRSR